MHKYILKRLIMLIPVILGVSFIVFFILSLTPGDPAAIIIGEKATADTISALRNELGLNDPIVVQYARYMFNMVRGDLGTSYVTGRNVFNEVISAFPATLKLTFWATVIAVFIGIPIGVVSATKQYTLMDNLSMVVALLGVSMPGFWLGLMLILLFSLRLGWLPSGGAETALSVIMPAFTLGVASAATIARMTRSSMLEVIRQDYIRTAKAKGVNKRVVVRKHALKNALIPVVTIVGIQFGDMLGGAVLAETVFAWPGLGRMLVDSIKNKDIPMVMGCMMLATVSFSVVNLLVDIIYAFLDPRIKAEYK